LTSAFSFALTAVTDTKELDPMTASGERRRSVYLLVQRLVNRQLQIDDRAAALTDKVVVRPDIGVEAIEGAPEINLLDQSLLDQDVEIAIDRTHTQAGKLRFHLIVDPLGGGMPSRVLQQLENPIPLSASLVVECLFDRRPPW
jgi:hypothetical protein